MASKELWLASLCIWGISNALQPGVKDTAHKVDSTVTESNLRAEVERLRKENAELKQTQGKATKPLLFQPPKLGVGSPVSLFSGLPSLFGDSPQLPHPALPHKPETEEFVCKKQEMSCVCSARVKDLDPKDIKVRASGNSIQINGGRHGQGEESDTFEFSQQLDMKFQPQGQPVAEYKKKEQLLTIIMQPPKQTDLENGGDNPCRLTASSSSSSSSFTRSGGKGFTSTSFSSSSSSSSGSSSLGVGSLPKVPHMAMPGLTNLMMGGDLEASQGIPGGFGFF